MKMQFCIYAVLILSAVAGIVSAANPQVTLQITGAVNGTIVLEIYADKAPVTAANFISYVKSGFYNGLIFHRVINNFMIQGGGFDTNVVYKTPTYPQIINESSNGLSNIAGTIAMARTPDPHSASSQFFINQVNNLSLDYASVLYDGSNNAYSKYGYCVFGKVLSGMNVVNAIAVLPTTTKNSMTDVPVNNVIIQSATVTFNAPVCAEKFQGDVNKDCKVNLADYAAMAEDWLDCNSILPTCN